MKRICWPLWLSIDFNLSVVAVHGIGVNPKSTWVHSKTKVNWLSDTTMLPEALPKARIMTYNYESYWFGDNAVKQTVSKVANKMLLALRDKREECRDRPIIFLGHCFGGLVIQEVSILFHNVLKGKP